MSCLSILSGMRAREIIECEFHPFLFLFIYYSIKSINLTFCFLKVILTSYDFDGTQQLSIDEVTLALKSASSGICKVYGKKFPREELIESLVSEVANLTPPIH